MMPAASQFWGSMGSRPITLKSVENGSNRKGTVI
jgi:hypothetical protein